MCAQKYAPAVEKRTGTTWACDGRQFLEKSPAVHAQSFRRCGQVAPRLGAPPGRLGPRRTRFLGGVHVLGKLRTGRRVPRAARSFTIRGLRFAGCVRQLHILRALVR